VSDTRDNSSFCYVNVEALLLEERREKIQPLQLVLLVWREVRQGSGGYLYQKKV
jgi:hypothetical protein